ncbi:MAG: ATP-dependent DNA helicase Rep [Myxococcales bacterium]|nr:ATP-dependent DNA helicase Rep [Myxococcales bacterium]
MWGKPVKGVKPVDLSGLNPEQRAAVDHIEGPLLVLAGAGSGKTRVITFRIAHLLNLGVRPSQILALSFTNKAATEMKERLVGLVGEPAKKCQTSTFHALGVKFIKAEYEAAGLRPGFSIFDEGDQLEAVRHAMQQLQIDPKQYDPKNFLEQITQYKSQLIHPASLRDARTAAMIYEGYLRRMRLMNAVDFEDLIRLPVVLMETHREVKLRWRNKFKYILVDEYQDSNGAQLRMLKALSEGTGNICVVGDDDQSIYGWRGAVASNILKFDQHFHGARMIALTQNYRSTNYILKAANSVIENNPERHPKTLWSAHGDGEKLCYRQLDHGEQEAEWVVKDLNQRRYSTKASEGLPFPELHWRDFSILYRTNAQARAFEEGLRSLNIPYRIVGGTRFFDRKEVRDAIAYLRLLCNPSDDNAFRRIINYPQRGIGDQTLERIAHVAQSRSLSMWAVSLELDSIGLSPINEKAVQSFTELLQPYQERIEKESWSTIFLDLLETIKFKEALIKQYKDGPQTQKRWQNVEELANGLKNSQNKKLDKSLNDYLNRISLEYKPKTDEQKDEVTLMSLHSSKGLEFHTVYMVGVEEGWMPHEREPGEGSDLEEERRLAYVGITRAQRVLLLTSASKRLSRGKLKPRRVSRFLAEIPEVYFEGGREGRASQEETTRVEAKRNQAFNRMFNALGKGS